MSTTKTHEVTCTCCPSGCTLVVELSEDGVATYLSGAGCARGKKYGPAELTHPGRVVTTTVWVPGVAAPLPVRSSEPVPKELVAQVVRVAKDAGACVQPPVHIGDVIVTNVLGTGVDVVASGRID